MTISYPYEPEDETMICSYHDGDLYCVLFAGHSQDHEIALATTDE